MMRFVKGYLFEFSMFYQDRNALLKFEKLIIMRPSSLGGGRILRRTLSVCLSVRLSVRPSRYCCQRHVAPPSELQ